HVPARRGHCPARGPRAGGLPSQRNGARTRPLAALARHTGGRGRQPGAGRRAAVPPGLERHGPSRRRLHAFPGGAMNHLPLPIRTRRCQHGLTVVELMVAMVLGLFLAGVVSWTYLQTASATRFGALDSQMNEEG